MNNTLTTIWSRTTDTATAEIVSHIAAGLKLRVNGKNLPMSGVDVRPLPTAIMQGGRKMVAHLGGVAGEPKVGLTATERDEVIAAIANANPYETFCAKRATLRAKLNDAANAFADNNEADYEERFHDMRPVDELNAERTAAQQAFDTFIETAPCLEARYQQETIAAARRNAEYYD